jgi:hypothetical protein
MYHGELPFDRFPSWVTEDEIEAIMKFMPVEIKLMSTTEWNASFECLMKVVTKYAE